MIILRSDSRLQNKIITDFSDDGIRLMGDNIIADNIAVIDRLYNDGAHRDGFQLIPKVEGLPNRQYAAASIKNPRISHCTVFSEGLLQGIFCSDGLIENAQITDNLIQTSSQHNITLNGLLSGTIARNHDENGMPLPVILNNLRIGGGIANVWVTSFKHHAYEKIKGKNITDNRGKRHHRNGIYVENLDLDAFRSQANNLEYTDLHHFCESLSELAITCSD